MSLRTRRLGQRGMTSVIRWIDSVEKGARQRKSKDATWSCFGLLALSPRGSLFWIIRRIDRLAW